MTVSVRLPQAQQPTKERGTGKKVGEGGMSEDNEAEIQEMEGARRQFGNGMMTRSDEDDAHSEGEGEHTEVRVDHTDKRLQDEGGRI